MTTVRINETDYNLKTNWNEVDYSEYCNIINIKEDKENTLLKRVSNYSGIEYSILEKLSATQLAFIIDIVKFMDEPEFVYDFAERFEEPALQVANETYGKMEAAKTALMQYKNPLLAGADIVEIYSGEDIRKQPITKSINRVSFFLSSLNYSLNGLSGSMNTNPPSWNIQRVLKCLNSSGHGQQ